MNKIKFGLIGLVFVLVAPALDYTRIVMTENSVSERTELSNQVFREKFGESPVSFDDPELLQFLQESQVPKPSNFEIIRNKFFYWMIWYISPGGGFLFGILSILKDRKIGKLLGILSILGALSVIYSNFLAVAFMRMF